MSEEATPSTDIEASPGQVVYDGEGNQLGRIQGFSEHGFEVSVYDHVSLTGRSSPFASRRSLSLTPRFA